MAPRLPGAKPQQAAVRPPAVVRPRALGPRREAGPPRVVERLQAAGPVLPVAPLRVAVRPPAVALRRAVCPRREAGRSRVVAPQQEAGPRLPVGSLRAAAPLRMVWLLPAVELKRTAGRVRVVALQQVAAGLRAVVWPLAAPRRQGVRRHRAPGLPSVVRTPVVAGRVPAPRVGRRPATNNALPSITESMSRCWYLIVGSATRRTPSIRSGTPWRRATLAAAAARRTARARRAELGAGAPVARRAAADQEAGAVPAALPQRAVRRVAQRVAQRGVVVRPAEAGRVPVAVVAAAPMVVPIPARARAVVGLLTCRPTSATVMTMTS